MGGIYHHFASKEDIYETLLQRSELGHELPRLAALFGAAEFPENLAAIGRAILDIAQRYQDDFKLVYIDILEFQGRNIRPIIEPVRQAFVEAFTSILSHRVSRGEVAPAHPAVIGRVSVGMFLYLFLEDIMLKVSLAEQIGLTDEDISDQMADLLLHGLLRTPAAKEE